MKIIKIILGVALLAVPFSLHLGDSIWGRVIFMMAPIGAYAHLSTIFEDTFHFAHHSFKWYTEDGLIDYNLFFDNVAELGAAHWFTEYFPFGISAAGILTIIVLYALIVYVILSFFDRKEISIIADIIMISCAILSLVAMILYLDSTWASFDFNFPIFPILALALGVGGLVKSLKTKKRRRKKR